MRQCKGRYFKDGKFYEFELGYFHQWGSEYEEFEAAPWKFYNSYRRTSRWEGDHTDGK